MGRSPNANVATLTKARAAVVVGAVATGASLAAAAKDAGVRHQDVLAWNDRGVDAHRGKYAEFAADIERAMALSTARVGLGPVAEIVVPQRYEPHAKQRQLHALSLLAGHRIVAACCGRRGGKTSGGGAHVAALIVRDIGDKLAGAGRWEGEPHFAWSPGVGQDPRPFLRYAIVSPTYALLDEPKISLQGALGRAETGGIIVHQTTHGWWLLGGVRLDMLSGDHPERLVSHGYDGVWYDEAARLKPSVWWDNMRPTLSDTRGWALFTTTPVGKNWFWSDIWARGDPIAAAELAEVEDKPVEDILDPDVGCVSWTTADNTFIPHLAEEMEVARRQMPPALFLRNYYASFEAFEGQMFALAPSKHGSNAVNFPREAFAAILGGFDIGLSPHPASFTAVGRTHDGKWHELVTITRKNTMPHSDDAWRAGDSTVWTVIVRRALEQIVGPSMWQAIPVYFPADNQVYERYFRAVGFNTRRAYQAHEPAVTWMQVALHNELIDIRSSGLWRCLTNIRWPAKGESSSKLWVNKDDDPWDSLRYALSEPIRRGELHGVPKLRDWTRR